MTPEGSPRPRGPFARDVVVPYGRGRDRRWRWSQRIGGRQILHIGFFAERDAMDDRQRALDQIHGIAPAEMLAGNGRVHRCGSTNQDA